jgi:virginiamycin A acetyltransferase
MRRILKAFVVVPVLALCWLFRIGWLRFETGSFLLATVPGGLGVWWRRNWYRRTLQRCGLPLFVDWMSFIYLPDTGLGDDVYIGPFSSIVSADIGDHVLIGTRVSIARGNHQHGSARLDIPMTEQPGQPRKLKIGSDVWVGTGAVVLADIAPGTIVGAGAVITKAFEPYSILAGVPAKVIRKRGPSPVDETLAEVVA